MLLPASAIEHDTIAYISYCALLPEDSGYCKLCASSMVNRLVKGSDPLTHQPVGHLVISSLEGTDERS